MGQPLLFSGFSIAALTFGHGILDSFQCHLKNRIPAMKNTIPVAVRITMGNATSPNPAPSIKTLRMPSAIMVSGNF